MPSVGLAVFAGAVGELINNTLNELEDYIPKL